MLVQLLVNTMKLRVFQLSTMVLCTLILKFDYYDVQSIKTFLTAQCFSSNQKATVAVEKDGIVAPKHRWMKTVKKILRSKKYFKRKNTNSLDFYWLLHMNQ